MRAARCECAIQVEAADGIAARGCWDERRYSKEKDRELQKIARRWASLALAEAKPLGACRVRLRVFFLRELAFSTLGCAAQDTVPCQPMVLAREPRRLQFPLPRYIIAPFQAPAKGDLSWGQAIAAVS
jgi:hypothetical protein